MKRLLAIIIALTVLLGGCSVIEESDAVGIDVPVSELVDVEGEFAGRVETAAVYFYNADSDTLTAELRQLKIAQDTNPAEVAVEELLGGPENADGTTLESIAPDGMTLDKVEFSHSIANVYLKYSGEPLQAEERFTLELAITNTVADILGAQYTCVFYNGSYEGLAGDASGPHEKQTGSVSEAWTLAKTKYDQDIIDAAEQAGANEETITSGVLPETSETSTPTPETTPDPETTPEPEVREITTVLYFVSADGEFILPEVRNVEYTGDDYVETLIKELIKGPQASDLMRSPLPEELEVLDAMIEDTETGSKSLKLDLSELPRSYDFWGTEDTQLSYAALIYTITGFIPQVTTVDLYVLGKQIGETAGSEAYADGMQRSDFVGSIGSSVPIYLEDKSSDLLIEVSRSVEQSETWSVKARLNELLFVGPLAIDENVDSVRITGTEEDDILGVDVYGDTAYVNLSAHFKEACGSVSAEDETLLVYAIVNTLTAMDGITRVQFLIEGEQSEELAGTLNIADPFLRNYGIIAESS